MDPHFYWYLTRAAGTVTFGLLTLSTALGLLMATRLGDRLFHRNWIFELHKFSSVLALGFLGLHLAALIPDPWTSFRVVDLFVPGTSVWKPLAVALGVIGMYGALVGAGTFYIRRFIGNKTWRALHYTTFATFFLALLHGAAAGTDSGLPFMQLMYASAGLLISALTLYRIADAEPGPESISKLAAPAELAA